METRKGEIEMDKLRMIFHGEVCFMEVNVIDSKAKKIDCKEDSYIVGESETLHNDHRVKYVEDQVELYMTEDDKIFISTIGTEIYCPNKHRHDSIKLPAGKWEVGHAKEYDYFSQIQRKVRD